MKICVSLDTSVREAERVVEALPRGTIYAVGWSLIVQKGGLELIERMRREGCRIVWDLKLRDSPRAVGRIIDTLPIHVSDMVSVWAEEEVLRCTAVRVGSRRLLGVLALPGQWDKTVEDVVQGAVVANEWGCSCLLCPKEFLEDVLMAGGQTCIIELWSYPDAVKSEYVDVIVAGPEVTEARDPAQAYKELVVAGARE